MRKPEQPAKTDTLELTYNPKQTMDRTRAVLERVNNKKDANSPDNNQASSEQKQPELEEEQADDDAAE